MIVSDTLECYQCGKRLCECHDHLVYDDHDFCDTGCILDYIDKDILQGEEVVSTGRYKEICACKRAEW